MVHEVQSYRCPHCNAPIKTTGSTCEFCGSEYFISSLSFLANYDETKIKKCISFYKMKYKENPENSSVNSALGLCYLDLGLTDFSEKYLKKAIELEPENGENYYYYAISFLGKKKIKTHTLSEIRKIEEYLEAAKKINAEKSKYYFLHAIIKYEFYLKNGLRVSPTIQELLEKGSSLKSNKDEINQMLKRFNLEDKTIVKKILASN